ncbi:hypothetical protein ACFP56_16665 [Paenibacillus septentrionalis]|uniref:Uncharacterized protein n=1 Tax=Paenibacillus septentrionalis TaxID=429342 RepID=A0ABW1V8G7_9BACL
MNYLAFKSNSLKEYLGFCEQKGFIYSVPLDQGTFSVVALQNGTVTTLIQFTVQPCKVRMKV